MYQHRAALSSVKGGVGLLAANEQPAWVVDGFIKNVMHCLPTIQKATERTFGHQPVFIVPTIEGLRMLRDVDNNVTATRLAWSVCPVL